MAAPTVPTRRRSGRYQRISNKSNTMAGPTAPTRRRSRRYQRISKRASRFERRSQMKEMLEYEEKRRKRTKLTDLSDTIVPTLSKSMSSDCISELYGFLKFQEIEACCGAGDKTWSNSCSKKLFQRMVENRWTFKAEDLGMGSGVEVRMSQHKDWKRMVMCRELLEDAIEKKSDIQSQILVITQMCEHNLDDHVYFIEGLRWIAEIFDSTVKGETNYNFPTPHISKKFLRTLSLILKEYRGVPWIQQLAAKSVGVLNICEANRAYADDTKMVDNLVASLSFYVNKEVSEFMATALWACVILCRPFGGTEGQTLTSFETENFHNVRLVEEVGGIDVLFEILRQYNSNPLVLSKAFWLVVNLALVDEVKQHMMVFGVIPFVLEALKASPDCKELQYRGCFALINLSIRPDAKRQIRELDGLDNILGAMQNFPEDCDLQRVCCNVMRSLIFGDQDHFYVTAIVDGGGMELLLAARERFEEREETLNIIDQTIYWLENF